MSESIFETYTDERGNISVRISQEVQVLTREEANRIEAEYRRMQAENARLREQVDAAHMSRLLTENENESLRELVHVLLQCRVEGDDICAKCNYRSPLHGGCMADVKADELGVEVD